jgi:Flp pilus assembly protein TadB
MKWMSDEREAARHPLKAAGAAFGFGWASFTVFAYLRWTHRHLLPSALVGLGFGALLAVLVTTKIGEQRGWPSWIVGGQEMPPLDHGRQGSVSRIGKTVRRRHFEILCLGIALVLFALGLALQRWGIVVAALPFAALAAVLTLLRRRR